MNHRPFEDWLLNQDPLTPAQRRELQDHLQVCPKCAALVEVDLALKAARQVAPHEGFTDRFHLRLEAQRKALRRRNVLGFLILALAVVGGLVWLILPTLQLIFQQPVAILASILSFVMSLWSSLRAMGHVSELFLKIMPGFVSPVVWGMIVLGAAGWGLLWFLSLSKISKNLQGV